MTAARTLKTPADLAAAGLLPADRLEDAAAVAHRYAIAVTPAMAALIDTADPADPIARQFLPDARELATTPEERADPIGDSAHSPVKGIVHRYPDRVLLKAVHVCPVYCRFCFRREMVGPAGDGTLSPDELQACFAYIRSHPQIWEVILTGGDPLVLSPRRLGEIMREIAGIAHVQIVRIHSRVPIVDPALVNGELIQALKACGKTVYVAIHANHPREMSLDARNACARLADAGISLISQTVLLRGINDDADILAQLMRRFVENRIKPYYLHHPDLAPGTSHFRLDIEEGQALVAALRGRVSGLCQPTYVLDIPGGFGKAVIAASAVRRDDEDADIMGIEGTGAEGKMGRSGKAGAYTVRDYRGREHAYPPSSA
ncbi:lysine-2,3-aminomutase-like protein [Rhizobium sp. SSA_523]|uniref:lysine-2,3-aminomutase-like protein n=1 Tax=Rhizobium sp. SSA_523 TaxID=2952477 RepID=UPI002091D504|nr:lysine-2,3-aminomutase-like protein [Rhizobium sp. SSA_523]MCO5734536.1 lysine-2,3-aminomutase-like protein [Rhizobium sp. SSA_523]WKC23318.1 lysine-2,3-aminomutase-like protein [Rhizobium sp. SSA_523]